LCLKANQLDPVEQKEIVDAATAVKQATLNLLQQYRSIGDDLTPFNRALIDLALQINNCSNKLKSKVFFYKFPSYFLFPLSPLLPNL
jgi:hypothetical protein